MIFKILKLWYKKFIFKEKLKKIYYILCYINSNHGINMKFTLNVNNLDLSKKHPDHFVFYDKNGKWLMDYFKEKKAFWLPNEIWSKLKHGLNDEKEIEDLVKNMLETRLKCEKKTISLWL